MDRSTAKRYQQYVHIAAIVLVSIPAFVGTLCPLDGWLLMAIGFSCLPYIYGIIVVEDAAVERIWSKVEE